MTIDTKPMSPAALRKLLEERDRFWRALHIISKYMPPRELETKSGRVYGLPPDEATEYAYEQNVAQKRATSYLIPRES